MEFFALIILFTLYFLPSIVALLRKAPDIGSVIVVNLFLGWTFLGWVISMAMAARSNTTASINVNVSQQPGYGYAGVAYGQGQPAMAPTYGGPQTAELPPGQPEQLPQLQQLPKVQPTHQRHQVPQASGDQVYRPTQAPPSGPAPSQPAPIPVVPASAQVVPVRSQAVSSRSTPAAPGAPAPQAQAT